MILEFRIGHDWLIVVSGILPFVVCFAMSFVSEWKLAFFGGVFKLAT